MANAEDVVGWLRAAGETSRLRLLALCSTRAFSVSDLARAVGQSEPRVSRHLKILCDVGLLSRVRQGQWVHYQAATESAAASFLQGLLGQLDRTDPVVVRDRDRALAHIDTPAEGSTGGGLSESRLGRALRGFIETNTLASHVRSMLVVGVEHPELVEYAAGFATECVALTHSRRSAQAIRARAEQRGFSCRVVLASNGESLNERDIGKAGHSFDVIVLDHVAVPVGAQRARMLEHARQSLAPSGRLWLFERYESLEDGAGERVVEHPLGRLRRLLKEAGLSCERLSPIEADGEHVLAAAASSVAQAAAGAA